VDAEGNTRFHVSIPHTELSESSPCRLIDEHLHAGRSVVVDNTNPTPAERAPLIAIAYALGARITSYSFVVSVEDALRRNAGREGRARIEEVGIFSVAKRLVPPSEAEGFDAMFEVRLTETGFVVAAVGVSKA
jgi:hypothetical protein